MARIPGVLIIDQNPDTRFQLQRLVQQTGFSTSGQAGLGTEAVAAATELRPELILCGLKDPVARVVQTLESLVHALPETPIVVYSESDDIGTVRQAMLAGARDFIQAPVKPDDLKRALTGSLESQERRRLRESGGAVLGPQGTVVTVFGAKGGVGKTTVATNLAVGLARTGSRSTVLVDADDTFGDAAAALALVKERTVIDALREVDSAENGSLKKLLSYHSSGLAVLPAASSPFEWRDEPGERLTQLLSRLARQFDMVVVDTGSTMSEVSLAALEAASLILWVTTPEYASVHDSLQALEALRAVQLPDDRIRVVLNVASPDVEIRPESIEEALDRHLFWTIPYDSQLRSSAQMGQPLIEAHPHSAAAANFVDLAAVVGGTEPEPKRTTGGLRGFFAGRGGSLLKRVRPEEKEARQ